jgi:hypothetical protein
MPASHVALAQRMKLQRDIKNAMMRGDTSSAQKLQKKLQQVNAVVNKKK